MGFEREAPKDGKAITLPCGKCLSCLLERARQWAVRCMHEARMHEQNSFLTLTYDNEHLPKDGSLKVEHCQDFMKRLRSRISPTKVRFFLGGEYGEKLSRPHYHVLLFGYDFPDKRPAGNQGGHVLYESRLLNEVWGQGGARIGSVSFETAAYVANYAQKKVVGSQKVVNAHYQGRKPEFLLMSRRPGIGATWFARFSSDVFPRDEVVVRGRSTRPPRFYDGIFEREHPEVMSRIREKRELEAGRLEEFVSRSGYKVLISSSCNPVRLSDADKIARAKLALKRRSLEA